MPLTDLEPLKMALSTAQAADAKAARGSATACPPVGALIRLGVSSYERLPTFIEEVEKLWRDWGRDRALLREAAELLPVLGSDANSPSGRILADKIISALGDKT